MGDFVPFLADLAEDAVDADAGEQVFDVLVDVGESLGFFFFSLIILLFFFVLARRLCSPYRSCLAVGAKVSSLVGDKVHVSRVRLLLEA